MIDPHSLDPIEDTDSAPLGPESEAAMHERATHDIDPDDMFDPMGT